MIQTVTEPVMYVQLPDKRRLAYSEFGDPDGKPLLYFHGGLSSRLDIAFADGLGKERGIRIIAPNRPGIGTSDRKAGRTMLDWADDVEHFMSALGLAKIPLLGWSLGGSYVWPCAYKLPHLFTRVGTSGSCAPLLDRASIDELGLGIDRLMFKWPKSQARTLEFLLYLSNFVPPPIVKWDMEMEFTAPADRAIIRGLSVTEATEFIFESGQVCPAGNIDDYWALSIDWGFRLEDITLEATLWHGGDDKVAPLAGARRLVQAIPNATLQIIPDTGHFLLRKHLRLVLDRLVQ